MLQGRRGRWAATWMAALVVVGLGAVAAGSLDKEAAGFVVALLSLVASVLAVGAPWAWRSPTAAQRSSETQREAAASALAALVREQWGREATLRQLFSPWPLPVAWTSFGAGRVADRGELSGIADGTRFDRVADLVRCWAERPGQRLVLVGEGGTGKSTCALLLTLGLLDHPEVRQVPVPLSAASFDPEWETPAQWIARELRRSYPLLEDAERFGPSAAADLIAGHHVIPVLDGLDELPASRLRALIRGLAIAHDPRSPLVITCREDQFTDAVRECRAIPRAALLKPSPVPEQEALRLLSFADQSAGATDAWTRIARHIASDADAPVATVLRSPMGVGLVRAAYADGTGDPADLLDRRRFPDATALEAHLLDSFVPSLFERAAANHPDRRGCTPAAAEKYLRFLSRKLTEQGTADLAWWQLRQWCSLTASAWKVALFGGLCALVPLLVHVESLSREQAARHDGSWQLAVLVHAMCTLLFPAALLLVAQWTVRRSPSLPRPLWVTAVPICVAALVPVVVNVVYAMLVAPFTLQSLTLGGMVVVGGYLGMLLPVVSVVGLPLPPLSPRRGHFSMAGWRRRLRGAAIRFTMTALIVFVAAQVSSMLMYCSEGAPHSVLYVSCAVHLADTPLAAGAVSGLLAAGAWWYESSGSPADVATPGESLRIDRTVALWFGLAGSLLINIEGASVMVLPPPGAPDHSLGQTIVILLWDWLSLLGPTGALIALASTSWPYYMISRLRFALTGELPLRLQTFLTDAHRLGVLRRNGAVYQFRHITVQHRLAMTPDRVPVPRPSPPPPPHGRAPGRPRRDDHAP
ncbi:hypothetical protein [Streptomyces sp. NPDC059010]|uniref:hypothetical protein n=1 Tax=Streptomyces sp. NPDC059010 TaxID=3346695 RepID=UPI00367B031C